MFRIEKGYWPYDSLSKKRIEEAHRKLIEDTGGGNTGFPGLAATEKHLALAVEMKKEISHPKHLVVCGMGGSSLGTKALLSVFGPAEGTEIHVLDTIEPAAVRKLLLSLPFEETVFNVVTKSGRTLETLTHLNVILQECEKRGRKPGKNIILTTAASEKNELFRWAEKHGIRTLPFPEDVEGRYSVLSCVGLFPALFMDMEPQTLLEGAREMVRGIDKTDNLPLKFAADAVKAMEKGMETHIFFPYSVRLESLGKWFSQLWAESLGKDGKGQIPVVALGPQAQHSLLQLYLDGKRDWMVSLIGIEEQEEDIILERTDLPAGYLAGKSVGEILHTEMEATRFALTTKKVPNQTILLRRADERSIGELIMYLEMATAYAGYLLGVDPYNQPAVEIGKKHSRELLETT